METIPAFSSQRIWSAAAHNAFTDLVWFEHAWWCVFREASDHVSDDGQIRLLRSKNGQTWFSEQVFSLAGDLRDPCFVVSPQGQLLVLAALRGSRKQQGYSHQVYAWVLDKNTGWDSAQTVGERDLWLWRVAIHQQEGLGIAYKVGGDYHTRLYRTNDGLTYTPLLERLRGNDIRDEYSNESGLCFDATGTAWCLLRRDPENALLGSAVAPYTQWHWRDTEVRVGGPVLTCLNDQRLLSVVRLYGYTDNKITSARTSLAWLDKTTGHLTECGLLPSGGDTSYAGLVVRENIAYVSYYSSHEEKSAIYFATVPLSVLKQSFSGSELK